MKKEQGHKEGQNKNARFPWYRLVLPKIMAVVTRETRYLPDIDWKGNWTHKAFRAYEWMFFRRHGIRPETSLIKTSDGKVFYAFHTVEAAISHFESHIRKYSIKKILPIKIYVPVLSTPQGIPVFASPYLFAIAYDNSAIYGTNGTSGNSTQSFTTSGSNRFLALGTTTSNNTVTATYNGVSMTISKSHSNSNGWELRSHYLINPASGANNVVVNFSTGGSRSGWGVTSYSGCKQSAQPDSDATTSQVTSSPISPATTVVASGCWLWSASLALTTGTQTASTGATERQENADGVFSLGIYDSNGTVGTGSQSMSITCSGTITNIIAVIMSIAPVPTTEYSQSVTATTTITASTLKEMAKTISASATATGSVLKQMSVALTANVTNTAYTLKELAVILIASLTATGDMVATKVYLVALDAATTIAGVITKIPGKLLSAGSTVTASVDKLVTAVRTLTASTTITGSVLKGMSKTVTATTTATASITKIPGKILSAASTVTASVVSGLAKVLEADVTVTGVMDVGRAVIMNAAVTATATVDKTVGKLLAVTLSIVAKVIAPFWKTKYPAHGDDEDYEIKYPHD